MESSVHRPQTAEGRMTLDFTYEPFCTPDYHCYRCNGMVYAEPGGMRCMGCGRGMPIMADKKNALVLTVRRGA